MTAAALSPRRKTLALLTLIVALTLEIVDLTIVNTALPAIKADVGADAEASQWIIAGYALSFALLLMAGGRLGDSLGYRRMFLAGVTGFTLASLGCGLAADGTQLVIARLLQGATGAMMAPQFMAFMQILFDPLERIARLALFGVIGGLAAIAGPILGGLLIEADLFGLGWRIIFLINLPVGLIAFAGGLLFLPDARSGRPAGLDLCGMTLFAAAVAALFWPLLRAHEDGWSALSLLCLALAGPLAWAGLRHVTNRVARGQAALFDPALFAIPSFRQGLSISIVFSAASAGFLMVFAFALQAERGATPLVTGLLHMPFGIGAMIGIGLLGPRYLPRVGRWILAAGSVVMAAGILLLFAGIAAVDLPLSWLSPVLILAGTGMGMTSGCINPVAVAQVDRDHAGAASGLLKTSQQLGSAAGIAAVGGLYFSSLKAGSGLPSMHAALLLAGLLVACALLAIRLPTDIFAQRMAPDRR